MERMTGAGQEQVLTMAALAQHNLAPALQEEAAVQVAAGPVQCALLHRGRLCSAAANSSTRGQERLLPLMYGMKRRNGSALRRSLLRTLLRPAGV
jgi:hypothetical protein